MAKIMAYKEQARIKSQKSKQAAEAAEKTRIAAEKAEEEAMMARILSLSFNEAYETARQEFNDTMADYIRKEVDQFYFSSLIRVFQKTLKLSKDIVFGDLKPVKTLTHKSKDGGRYGCEGAVWNTGNGWWVYSELYSDTAGKRTWKDKEDMPGDTPLIMADNISKRLKPKANIFVITVRAETIYDSCVDEDPECGYHVGTLYRFVTSEPEWNKPVWIPDKNHDIKHIERQYVDDRRRWGSF